MSSKPLAKQEGWESVLETLRRAVEARLSNDEKPLAWFEPDLNHSLFYGRTALLVLTERRLLYVCIGQEDATSNGGVPSGPVCHAWPLEDVSEVLVREKTGIGVVEILGPSSQLASCHHTLARAAAAHRFADRFASLKRAERAEPVEEAQTEELDETLDQVVEESSSPLPPPQGKSLYRLVALSRERWPIAALGIFLTVACSAVGLIPPYVTMPLTDKVLIPLQSGLKVPFHQAAWYLLCLGGAFVLAWMLGWARTYVVAWLSERIVADLRDRTYAHLQNLSLEYFSARRTGDLMSRVGSDTDRISFFMQVYALDFVNDVLTILMTAVILLSIDPILALVTLCPLPVIVFLVHRVRKRLRRGFQLGNRAWSDMTSVLADTIPGIRVVKAFAQERREIERFRQSNQRVLQANDRVNAVWSFFGPMVALLTDLGIWVVWAFGAWHIYTGHVTVGVLTAFVAYIGRFYTRLDSMSRMAAAIQRAAASAQRVFEILDRVPSVAEPAHPVRLSEFRGEIEFREVGFHYGNRTVLDGVNLRIRPGEMIGLVGPSGAGKTTLVNLVCRFYDVADGAVLADGQDIRSFSLEWYRRHIGIVLQEPFLFYGTIAENIAYGRPDAAREDIIAAARAARAHEFILRLPDGYDSLVGERGQSLSGGERQRISIARALLIDPRILILDEATSSVDTETEREIQLALENLVKGRTTIAIAHRLSTLRRADRLVVIERGRITEVGHHDELVSGSGTYARLYHAQAEMAQGQPK